VPTSHLLDAAQGPLHPAARETLLAALDAGWADPRRLYAEARRARALLDQAREIIATGLGARPGELSFHGSGPQALSTGLHGVLHARRRRGRVLVASAVEHSVVLTTGRARAAQDPADALVEVPVDHHGRVDIERWTDAVEAGAVAVAALQHANGEVGTLQPLREAYAAARRADVPLLCDAQASLGRLEPPRDADVVVGAAASFAGPPAVGLLVVREGTRFALPGHPRDAEHGRADADPWVPLVLAAAEAWRQVEASREDEARQAYELVGRLRTDLAAVDGLDVVGHPTERLPHVLTASALYVDGEAVVHELAREGFLVASGSACTSSTLEPSHVLAAMGALSHGNLRLTLPLAAVSPDRALACAGLPMALAAVVAGARQALEGSPGIRATTGGPLVVDARGTLCPQPVIDVARWWRTHPDRDHVRLLADDPAARVDVPAWCRMTGRELRSVDELPEGGTAYEIGSGQPA
jgi:cysteine desulfurase